VAPKIIGQAARPLAAMAPNPGGRIINFSTSVVGTKLETYGVYAATKAGVEMLTAILAKELRGRSITVNAVARGPTATDLFLKGKSQELIDRFAKTPPVERSACRRTSPTPLPSSPAGMAGGSTAKSSAPTAASSDVARKLIRCRASTRRRRLSP